MRCTRPHARGHETSSNHSLRPPLPPLPSPWQAEADQRERVRQALQDAEAELAALEEDEDPYWVPFDDCPGVGEHCAACWGCPEAREFTRLR